MRTVAEISKLLDDLEYHTGDELEDEDLDFKEWDLHSHSEAIAKVIEYAICMANHKGGTVVFGVKDKAVGRAKAIVGVPLEIDPHSLKKQVYDSTDPTITPEFEFLSVPEGTGRLLVMQIHSGNLMYTDTKGKGKIRVGRDCMPLTGSIRARLLVEKGMTDLSSELVPGCIKDHISPSAIETARKWAQKERAPEELIELSDCDLLASLDLIKNNQITRAGILLFGKETSLKEHVPNYKWTHLRMRDDEEYTDRMDGNEAILIAIGRITDRIMADNPLTTIVQGMFHFEYRRYPDVVLREGLMNAFCHSDYRICSPILIRQYPDRIEMSNPGGLIAGITPNNILHHGPFARNRVLVEALLKLRLVNRSNLGITRMFKEMLIEGKEPPNIDDLGNSVRVVLKRGEFSAMSQTITEYDKIKIHSTTRHDQ